MLTTRFTELIGCDIPLQQAGMGGVATADLARAVTEAGALGMLGAAMVPAPQLAQTLDDLPAPVGVNFLMPFVDPDAVEATGEITDEPDWHLLENLDLSIPFMLSGGLHAQNVAEALRITRAPGVDVSSGVESAPGVKDPEKIRAFIRAARSAKVPA